MANVLAPRNPAEMLRVLAPGGTLIVVTPTERHLHELHLLRVHPGKRERLHAAFSPPQSARLHEFVMELDQPDVEALIAMGPSAHHRRRSPRAARVTASVVIETYRG
jgi:23S rRNA (guanine745-N1)-methyltransferase